MGGDWQHGIFGCFDDIMLCLTAYLCPCYVFGKTAETVGEDCVMCGVVTFVPLVNLLCHHKIRGKIRENKGIDGSPVNDLLMICCCPICSLMQEAQEMGVKSPVGASIARS